MKLKVGDKVKLKGGKQGYIRDFLHLFGYTDAIVEINGREVLISLGANSPIIEVNNGIARKPSTNEC